jgi:hypothetical protein
LPVMNSAKQTPTDHKSIAASYSVVPKSNSGARYLSCVKVHIDRKISVAQSAEEANKRHKSIRTTYHSVTTSCVYLPIGSS